jgi:hypothetical protein
MSRCGFRSVAVWVIGATLGLSGAQAAELVELFRGSKSFGYVTGIHSAYDRLFFFDSPVPAGSDGGDVYQFDLESRKARRVFQVQEQGVSVLRAFGGKLYIPGADAMEGWDLGNFYVSHDKGESFLKVRTIPVGVHIWDLTQWRGKLYVSTGSVRDGKGYGAVCESADGGKTWAETLIARPDAPQEAGQFGRCYALIPTEDALYASFVARDSQKLLPTPEREFYRYDGKAWTPVKLLPARVQTPYFGLRHREIGDASFILGRPDSYVLKGRRALKLAGLESRSTFMVALRGKDELYAVASSLDGKQSALYRASFAEVRTGKGSFEKVMEMKPGEEAISLEVHRGRLILGTKSEAGGGLYEVIL